MLCPSSIIYIKLFSYYLQRERLADYEDLRKKVEDMGLFEIKKWFFFLYFLHLIVLECLAYLVMSHFGTSWLPYLTTVLLLSTFQVTFFYKFNYFAVERL